MYTKITTLSPDPLWEHILAGFQLGSNPGQFRILVFRKLIERVTGISPGLNFNLYSYKNYKCGQSQEITFFLFVFFSSYHRCARGPFLLVAVFLHGVPCPRLIYLVAVRNCRLVASSSSLCWSTTVALHLWDMPLLHHLIFSASWPVGCWVIVVLHCVSSTFNIILTRIFKSVAEQRGLCSWNGYLLLFFLFCLCSFFGIVLISFLLCQSHYLVSLSKA